MLLGKNLSSLPKTTEHSFRNVGFISRFFLEHHSTQKGAKFHTYGSSPYCLRNTCMVSGGYIPACFAIKLGFGFHIFVDHSQLLVSPQAHILLCGLYLAYIIYVQCTKRSVTVLQPLKEVNVYVSNVNFIICIHAKLFLKKIEGP